MKYLIIILVVTLVLSILITPTNDNEILYQGITSKDIGIAFIGFTLALLLRTSDKK